MLQLAIVLYTFNTVLLTLLSFVFARTAVKTKASYPAALFLFSFLLLLHSAGTAVAYFFMAPYFGDEPLPFMSLVGALESAGLLVFLKVAI